MAFDVMGRVTQSQQITGDTIPESMTYTYNLLGALIEQKYPSGRVVRNVLDSNGNLATVQSKKNQSAGYWNYAQHFTYTVAGAVSSMQLGNGRWESTQFNSRLQPEQLALGSTQNATDKLKLNFTYTTTPTSTDNNGNVLSQTITVPTGIRGGTTYNGFTATQTYTYDSLDRIKQASETGSSEAWKQTFTYARYGNRSFDKGGTSGNYLTTTLARGCSTSTYNPNGICDKKKVNPNFTAGNNQITPDQDGDLQDDYLFDSSGNTTKDASGNTYVYDGENKQVEVRNSSNQTIGQYWYGGDGKRVKKYVPATGETTIFVYDASGKMAAEYSTMIETTSTAKVSYLTNDHLGSPRINTDANGNVTSRHDYQPFGEEIQRASYGSDEVRKKFTGYERDNETELNFALARYQNGSQGRFTSPDPMMASATKINPQTFNRYSYVINNPSNLTDATGLCPPVDDNPCVKGEIFTQNNDDGTTITYFWNGSEWEEPYNDGSITTNSAPAAGSTSPGQVFNPFQNQQPQGGGPLTRRSTTSPTSQSPASKFGGNVVNSARTSPFSLALSLLLNELANPSQSVGNGGDCDDVPDGCREDPDDWVRLRHYTNRAGINGIERDGEIRIGDRGAVFFEPATNRPLSPRDAEEKYGLRRGHGRDYVETDFPRQSVTNEYNPRTRTFEIVIRSNVPLVRPTFVRRR